MPSSFIISQHAVGFQIGHAQEIHRSFRVSGTPKNATFSRAQGKTVSGLHEVIQRSVRVGKLDGRGAAFEGADAGGSAHFGVHAHGKGRVVLLCVVVGLHREAEGIHAFGGHGDADESAGVGCHKIDVLRRGELSGADEIGFVFARGIIRHQHEVPQPQLLQHFLQRRVCDGVISVSHGDIVCRRGRDGIIAGGRGCKARDGGITAIDKVIHVECSIFSRELRHHLLILAHESRRPTERLKTGRSGL